MFWLYIVLMVVGLVGIIICKKKQKTNPNAQGLAFICMIPILIGAGGFIWENLGDGEQKGLIANESAFASARAGKVAAELKKSFAGKNAVILVNQGYDKEVIAKAGYDALVKGIEGVKILATEEMASDPNNPEPVDMQLNAKKYNAVFAKYKNADLFILYSQLPQDPGQIAQFTIFKGGKAKVALLSGEAGEFGKYIQKGIIVAATLSKNTGDAIDPDKKAPSDPNAAFDVRYVLVTPANLNQVYGQYKNLFINR